VEDLGVPLSYVIGDLEGYSSPLIEGESSIVIGTVEDGLGFPVFILVLFLALKYMEACLFLFSFGLIGVLSAVMTAATSLSRVLGDSSLCFSYVASFSPPFVSFSFSVHFVSSCSVSSPFSSSILVSSSSLSCPAESSVTSPSPHFYSFSSLSEGLIS